MLVAASPMPSGFRAGPECACGAAATVARTVVTLVTPPNAMKAA